MTFSLCTLYVSILIGGWQIQSRCWENWWLTWHDRPGHSPHFLWCNNTGCPENLFYRFVSAPNSALVSVIAENIRHFAIILKFIAGSSNGPPLSLSLTLAALKSLNAKFVNRITYFDYETWWKRHVILAGGGYVCVSSPVLRSVRLCNSVSERWYNALITVVVGCLFSSR